MISLPLYLVLAVRMPSRRTLLLLALLALVAVTVGWCDPPDIPIPNPLPRR